MKFITNSLRSLKCTQIPSSNNFNPLSSILTLYKFSKESFSNFYSANSRVKDSKFPNPCFPVLLNNLIASFVRSSHLFIFDKMLHRKERHPEKFRVKRLRRSIISRILRPSSRHTRSVIFLLAELPYERPPKSKILLTKIQVELL